MARGFESSRTFWSNGSGFPQRKKIQKAPARDRKQTREPAMERLQGAGTASNPPGEHRHGRKDAAPREKDESGASRQIDVLDGGSIARMFVFRRGANEPSLEQKMDARLEMRQVGD